jgi:hypothetical protein
MFAAAASGATLLVLVVGAQLDPRNDQLPEQPTMVDTPPPIAGCERRAIVSPRTLPRLVGADAALLSDFVCDDVELRIDVARYFVPRPGHEAAGGDNMLVDVEKMTHPTPSRVTLPQTDVLQYHYDRTHPPSTVWIWYAVGTRGASSALDTKLLVALNALLRREPGTAVFVLTATGDDSAAVQRVLHNAAAGVWAWYRVLHT